MCRVLASHWGARERAQLVATLTSRAALALHTAPFNASAAAPTALRHPLRIAAGAEGLKAWVRHLPRPTPIHGTDETELDGKSPSLMRAGATEAAGEEAPVSALFVHNTEGETRRARLPWDAVRALARTLA